MMSPKRLCVLQVLPALETGGVERGTLDIAKALIAAGHRAIVVSSGGALVSPLVESGAEHICLPVHSKNPMLIRKNATDLAALINSKQVDIVHARSRAPAWSCYWATRRMRCPLVTTFHGTYGHGSAIKRWYNRIMCRSEQTIAVSQFIAAHIESVYGTVKPAPRVIHRGIDMSLFDPMQVLPEDVNHLRQSWGLKSGKPLILLPGRLTRWKGQVDFIHAIARLDRHDVQCVLVGSDQGRLDYRAELEALIQFESLSSVISIVDDCKTMSAAYTLADIVVSASQEPEAFGRVAAEAQAMGCITVATQHGGAMETIAPVQQAWQCQPHDLASLTTALERALLEWETDRERVKAPSRAYIAQHFSLDKMVGETLSLYDELLTK